MFRVCYIVLASFLYVTLVNARIDYKECEVKPAETQCLVQLSSKLQYPAQTRWVYDWDERKCYSINWSSACPSPVPNTNNFATEYDCMNECSGWA